MTTLLATSAALALGVVCLRTGRDPAALGITVLIHVRAACIWARREAWPALKAASYYYRDCVAEARRQV